MFKIGMSSLKDKPLKKCHTDKRKMIDDIHNEIIQNLSESEINSYFLDNGVILDKYYSGDEEININTHSESEGILSFFKTEYKNEEKKEYSLKKKDAMNEYMCNIDDNVQNMKYSNISYDKCKICGSQTHMCEVKSELCCSKCGALSDIIIVTEKSSYSDPPREVSYFSYKRINHFNEWLAQFQAKEKTELPENIYHDIISELNKTSYINISKLKYKDARLIIKKLNYNKYYEHIPHIISVLTNKRAPTLDRKTEEVLRSLFKEIQIPFLNNCPANRKNFLSYSYVLHKFCELLEFDHLLEYFPLLKSREKLHQQDIIWEKICKDLKWQYIPSL
jgi:hypothetical protein